MIGASIEAPFSFRVSNMKLTINLESDSVNYADVNTVKPVMKFRRPKRRMKMRVKRPKPYTPIAILRRKLANIRGKIIKRLDATTFRLGNKSKLPMKKMEANKYYQQYKTLKMRLDKLQEMKKNPQKLM
jgi:hypothetical protein